MADTENTLPPSKKRAAGREISRDNPGLDDEEETSEQEAGTFKRASDEVLASRRIVKVRRNQSSSTPSAPSSNPFAGIRLMPSTVSNSAASEAATKVEDDKIGSEEVDAKTVLIEETDEAKDGINKQIENKTDQAEAEPVADEKILGADGAKDDENKQMENKTDEAGPEPVADAKTLDAVYEESTPESGDKKEPEEDKTKNQDNKDAEGVKTDGNDKKDNGNENIKEGAEATSLSSFKQLSSSQNAFTGLTGTGFSSSNFSFGSIPKEGSLGSGSGSGSLFGLKTDQSSYPSFGFSRPNNGNSSLLVAPGASIGTKSEGSGFPSMKEVPVETGEENEKAVFTADSVLFEFFEGGWKERGKGELKVNVCTSGTGKARLIMRARGNYRLILNASLYPDMKLTNMDKKGITFACMNSAGEGKNGLSTFALKFKDVSLVEEFRVAVIEHKGNTAPVLKTPENSPKASD